MIRVERGAVPELVRDRAFFTAREEYEAFHSGGGTRATQKRLDPSASLSALEWLARDYVVDLFDGKCAYTEVRADEGRFHLHRPEADAYDERLDISPAHYWWTAMWYRNWYLASNEVASLKRNHFPVLGERAREPAPEVVGPAWEPTGDHLDAGVLLDPCEDRPEWHLQFLTNGTVRAWTDASAPWLGDDARRGPDTIRLLDLNNERLVRARRQAITAALKRIRPSRQDNPALDPSVEHIGAIRQALASELLDFGAAGHPPIIENLLPEIAPLVAFNPAQHPPELVDRVRRHVEMFDRDLARRFTARSEVVLGLIEDVAAADISRQPSAPATPAIPRTAAITRVVIKNFQAIAQAEFVIPAEEVTLEIDPAPPTPIRARQWKALLGENGTGKSATLKAIGLALAASTLSDLEGTTGINWSRLLRRGERQGRVMLEFTREYRIDLRFNRKRAWFVGGAPRMDAFVRGFGATRLLGPDDAPPEANVRLGNLYNPRIPVVDAEAWLLGLPNEGDFNVAAIAIAELLDRPEAVTGGEAAGSTPLFIGRTGGVLTVGGEPLDSLSDGYQAVIAMACDLMAGAGTGLSDMRNATGIVLIDEIGAHMHPKWRMSITRSLRKAFPSMQFIVSTHEPLCMRGLYEGEVIRVRRSTVQDSAPWHAVFDPIEVSPSKYRVDQLLTSEFFGLDTTIDPDVDRQFREYYALIRQQNPTPEQEAQRRDLRARLSQHGVLGYTRRDQLVYEAIDAFLAHEDDLDPEQRRRQRKETLAQIADIWRNVAERRRVGGPA